MGTSGNFTDFFRVSLSMQTERTLPNVIHIDPPLGYQSQLPQPDIEDESPYALSTNIIVQVTFYFVYSAIFVVAVTGNSLVLYVVSRNPFMQTPTNLFITNLAASDLLMNFLAVPFTPLSSFLDSWIFGKPMCHIVPMVQGCAVYVSTLTLTAIALDRYQVMFNPFAPKKSKSTCFTIILCIWICALSLVAPLAVFMELKRGDDGLMHCEENWPMEALERAYSFGTLVLQYFVPLCIIAYCYVKVSSKLTERVKNRSHTFSGNRQKARDENKRKDRTNRMLIAMVAVFAICWLPLNLIHVISGLRLKLIFWKFFIILFFVCHVLAMSSTCYNPMIYAWMNDSFRKEFIAVLPCFHENEASNMMAHKDKPYSTLSNKGTTNSYNAKASSSPAKNLVTDRSSLTESLKGLRKNLKIDRKQRISQAKYTKAQGNIKNKNSSENTVQDTLLNERELSVVDKQLNVTSLLNAKVKNEPVIAINESNMIFVNQKSKSPTVQFNKSVSSSVETSSSASDSIHHPQGKTQNGKTYKKTRMISIKVLDPNASLAASLRSNSPVNSSSNLLELIKKASIIKKPLLSPTETQRLTVHNNVKYTNFEIV